jgi:hypothetical protein
MKLIVLYIYLLANHLHIVLWTHCFLLHTILSFHATEDVWSWTKVLHDVRSCMMLGLA